MLEGLIMMDKDNGLWLGRLDGPRDPCAIIKNVQLCFFCIFYISTDPGNLSSGHLGED